MNDAALACWLLFSVEPTDRALAGWCPLPPHLRNEAAARQAVCGGTTPPLYGDTRVNLLASGSDD